MSDKLQFVVGIRKGLLTRVSDKLKLIGLVGHQEVRPVVPNPGIDGGNLMNANVLSAGKHATRANRCLRVFVVDKQVDDFIRRERGHHLKKYLLNLRNAIRPRLRILGPRQPRCAVPVPFARHVVTEFGGSSRGHFEAVSITRCERAS